jgi:hypothetical protein
MKETISLPCLVCLLRNKSVNKQYELQKGEDSARWNKPMTDTKHIPQSWRKKKKAIKHTAKISINYTTKYIYLDKNHYWNCEESEISSIYYLQTILYYFSISHTGGDSVRAILVGSSESVNQVTYTPRNFLISYFKCIFCRIITLWGHHTLLSHYYQGGGLEILGKAEI